MNYEISEIIKSIVGKADNGAPKAAFALTLDKHTESTNEDKEMSTVTLFNPELKLTRLGRFIVLDVIFTNNYDADLRQLWAVLENYGKINTEADDDTSYILSIMLVPTSYEGKVYSLLLNPIFWASQTPISGEKPNAIRLLFEEEHFGVYKNENVDSEVIKKAVEKQLEAEEQQFIQRETKRAEEEAYRQERDKKLEEMRRSGLKGE